MNLKRNRDWWVCSQTSKIFVGYFQYLIIICMKKQRAIKFLWGVLEEVEMEMDGTPFSPASGRWVALWWVGLLSDTQSWPSNRPMLPVLLWSLPAAEYWWPWSALLCRQYQLSSSIRQRPGCSPDQADGSGPSKTCLHRANEHPVMPQKTPLPHYSHHRIAKASPFGIPQTERDHIKPRRKHRCLRQCVEHIACPSKPVRPVKKKKGSQLTITYRTTKMSIPIFLRLHELVIRFRPYKVVSLQQGQNGATKYLPNKRYSGCKSAAWDILHQLIKKGLASNLGIQSPTLTDNYDTIFQFIINELDQSFLCSPRLRSPMIRKALEA